MKMAIMNVENLLKPLFLSIVLITAEASSALAQQSPAPNAGYGTIAGVVTTASKTPVGGATVTATRAGGGIRSTISGSDGIYTFADVLAGSWSLTITVEGAPDVLLPPVTVSAGKATRRDVAMNIPAGAGQAPSLVLAPVPAQAAAPTVPEALQAPDPAPEVDTQTPWADVGYVGWMNGTPRSNAPVFDTKFFTPEIRFDMNYLQSLNHPHDHTIVGSTEEFRSGEFQIEQVSFGGDFHWNNVRARFLSMFGMFATTTPRNDASSAVGQWDLQNAYRYFSEANAGYHFDVNHGLNVDLGVFVSYIGLFSYYNFDNWTYQPSFVSSNTPWFFNGLRVQWWPTQHLKIEPWLINGWQSYAKFNSKPGFGGQILWIPNDSLKLVFNGYSIGQDNLNCQAAGTNGIQGTVDSMCQPQNGGNPNASAGSYVGAGHPIDYSKVKRIHMDDSIVFKYYDAHGTGGAGLSKAAFSYTIDIGCQYGGGISCSQRTEQGQFFRHDVLQPCLVPQRSVCGDHRRRLHEQPGPVSRAHPAHQRSDGCQRFTVFHPAAGTETLSMGRAAEFSVHAQGLDHLVDGSDVSALERAVLVGIRRGDASWRQQRFTGELCRRRRRRQHRQLQCG